MTVHPDDVVCRRVERPFRLRPPRENLFPDLFRDGFPFPGSLRRHRCSSPVFHRPEKCISLSRSRPSPSRLSPLSLPPFSFILRLLRARGRVSYRLGPPVCSRVATFKPRFTATDNAAPLPNARLPETYFPRGRCGRTVSGPSNHGDSLRGWGKR